MGRGHKRALLRRFSSSGAIIADYTVDQIVREILGFFFGPLKKTVTKKMSLNDLVQKKKTQTLWIFFFLDPSLIWVFFSWTTLYMWWSSRQLASITNKPAI